MLLIKILSLAVLTKIGGGNPKDFGFVSDASEAH